MARRAEGLDATLRKRSIELVAGVGRACGGEVWSGRAARKVGHIVKDILLGERYCRVIDHLHDGRRRVTHSLHQGHLRWGEAGWGVGQ